jgi:hypothetical protein
MNPALRAAEAFGLLVLIATGMATGSEEIAEQQELECTVCHGDNEGSLLTDQGRYFQYLGTLEGFEQVIEKFGHCSYCHVREAESVELTREGFRFRWMMEDMEGLKDWLEENHPKPADEE